MKIQNSVFIFFLMLSLSHAYTVAHLNAATSAYSDIESVFGSGSYEVPDCGHHVNHITISTDSVSKRKVFDFTLHVNLDDDRCINTDRQRNEIKVYGSSPSWMKGYSGQSFSYAWKFKLNTGFKSSSAFTHLHQIKDDASSTLPYVTLTAEKNEFRLVLNNNDIKSRISLDELKGQWIQVTEDVTYGSNGHISLTAKRISDGVQMVHWSGSFPNFFGGNFMRPKWGFYRSLNDKTNLRDETVHFDHFCIANALSVCDSYLTPADNNDEEYHDEKFLDIQE